MLDAILDHTGTVPPGKKLPHDIGAAPTILPPRAKALAKDMLTKRRTSLHASPFLDQTAIHGTDDSPRSSARLELSPGCISP